MKQVIVVRMDLKLPRGKLAAQVAHASVKAMLHSSDKNVDAWLKDGMKKVVCKVESKEDLFILKERAKINGISTGLIKDAGKTVIQSGTVTCLGLGPELDEKIDKVTSHLKLL